MSCTRWDTFVYRKFSNSRNDTNISEVRHEGADFVVNKGRDAASSDQEAECAEYIQIAGFA